MNRTLKAMLRKHTAKFGRQWDQFLPGVLWAYRNTVHESTLEKPSFLLFEVDLRSPTEAALLPPRDLKVADLSNYREELVLSLSSAREHTVRSEGSPEVVQKAVQQEGQDSSLAMRRLGLNPFCPG